MTTTEVDRVTAAYARLTSDDVPEAAIDALVDELRGLHRKAALDFALTVGRLTLDRLFGGSLDAWRDGGEKSGSFRKLAQKLDPLGIPGLSSSSLARAVATVELDARVGVAGRPQLNASHVVAVLGLEPAQQERLLGEAEANDWTAAALKAEAERIKRETRPSTTRGRPKLPAFVKTVNRWERDAADESAFAELDQVDELDVEETERLASAVEKVRARCEILLGRLRG